MSEPRNVLYFDFETTTNDAEIAFPTQIGAELVRYDENGAVVAEVSMCTFCNFGYPIEPEAMAATGILTEDILYAPDETSPEVLEFSDLASKASYFCGYNAPDFDIPIAARVFDPKLFTSRAVIDGLRLSRKMYPDFPSYTLGAVAHRSGVFERIGFDYARKLHNALIDAKITRSIIENMLVERNCSIDELYAFQNEVLVTDTFSFGKYRGESIEATVARPDGHDYAKYLVSTDWFADKYPEEYMAILRLIPN